MKPVMIVFLLAIYLQSCCKAECVNGELYANFENFRAIDLDTIMLIKYQQGTGLQAIVDTIVSTRSRNPADTFRSYHAEQLHYPFDWKIVLPSLNKQYIISDLQLQTIRCCGKKVRELQLTN